mmetsp:Transcript_16889/g.43423  ORF Transcript_16889/g.43423 Transcript_16889/m.43423 type:complete len:154 (-) Transcript_16889:507-968(-)
MIKRIGRTYLHVPILLRPALRGAPRFEWHSSLQISTPSLFLYHHALALHHSDSITRTPSREGLPAFLPRRKKVPKFMSLSSELHMFLQLLRKRLISRMKKNLAAVHEITATKVLRRKGNSRRAPMGVMHKMKTMSNVFFKKFFRLDRHSFEEL